MIRYFPIALVALLVLLPGGLAGGDDDMSIPEPCIYIIPGQVPPIHVDPEPCPGGVNHLGPTGP